MLLYVTFDEAMQGCQELKKSGKRQGSGKPGNVGEDGEKHGLHLVLNRSNSCAGADHIIG